jgi:hypothetical protein
MSFVGWLLSRASTRPRDWMAYWHCLGDSRPIHPLGIYSLVALLGHLSCSQLFVCCTPAIVPGMLTLGPRRINNQTG